METARYAKLGQKWTCYSCDKKFYDLQKAEAICPSCNANQAARPQNEPAAAKKKPARKSTRKRAKAS